MEQKVPLIVHLLILTCVGLTQQGDNCYSNKNLLWFLTALDLQCQINQMTGVSVGTQASVLNSAMTQVAAGAQLVMVMVHGATIKKVSLWKYEYSVKST